jgi:hypothetical protein
VTQQLKLAGLWLDVLVSDCQLGAGSFLQTQRMYVQQQAATVTRLHKL